jgi:hypothetical protein
VRCSMQDRVKDGCQAFLSVSKEKGQRNFVVNLSSGPTNSIHQSEPKRSKGEVVFVFYIFSVTNNDV